jgi:hypothetical protein
MFYLFTCLLSSPKANNKLSTNKIMEKKTHPHAQKTEQSNLYYLNNNKNSVRAMTSASMRQIYIYMFIYIFVHTFIHVLNIIIIIIIIITTNLYLVCILETVVCDIPHTLPLKLNGTMTILVSFLQNIITIINRFRQ